MALRTAAFVVLLLPLTVFAQARDPIAGAWEQVSLTNLQTGQMVQLTAPHLRLILADGHYVQFTAQAGRTKTDTPRDKMTRDQLLDRYRLQGQFGTYQVKGNQLVRRIISAADPRNEGREFSSEFRIDGDALTVIGTDLQGVRTEARYRRLPRGTT